MAACECETCQMYTMCDECNIPMENICFQGIKHVVICRKCDSYLTRVTFEDPEKENA